MLTGTIINSLTILAGSAVGLVLRAVTRRSSKEVSADGLGGRLRNRYGNGGFVGCFRHRLCGGLRNGLGLRHHLLRQAGCYQEYDCRAVGIPFEFAPARRV